MGIKTERLLLVGSVDRHPVVPLPNLATVPGVVLEGLPRLAMVHRLVDCQRVRLLVAELERDIRQLVFLAKGEGEGDVTLPGGCQQFTVPASHIVWVVQVCQEGRGVAFDLTAGITNVTNLL